MNPSRNHVLTVASVSLGMLVASPTHAASLTQVSRSTWGATSGTPSYIEMYIYVPDQKASKPPVLVAAHSCGSTASGYYSGLPGIKAGADKNGYIIIYPDNPGRNCWDSGSDKSLTHDGGSDTLAIVQMVKYVLTKYGADPARVYAMGGSSGAMMTQALMAVYPDIFRAGAARAGVPAGCWHEGYRDSDQWSDSCAAGSVNKTAAQWADLVHAMYPGYTGHRPRLQIFHGTSDETIKYPNFNEAIEEWTTVLGLSTTATSTDSVKTSISSYDRKIWKNSCGSTVFEAWSAPGGTHSMKYEEDAILKFFGLDTTGADPELDDCGDAGVGGSGGASGTGGKAGVGGSGSGGKTSTGGSGAAAGGTTSTAKGGSATVGIGGGNTGTSGSIGSGGTSPTGGTRAAGGTRASGGTRSATGGSSHALESTASGGASSAATESGGTSSTRASNTQATGGTAVTAATGGIASLGGSTGVATSNTYATDTGAATEAGCGCRTVGDHSRAPHATLTLLNLLGAALVARRRRR